MTTAAPVLVALKERRNAMLPVPEGFTVGKPFTVLKTGPCRSRFSGEEVGPTLSPLHIQDMLRLLMERSAEDPVVIDWNHGSSPSFTASEDPNTGGSLGLVVGGWVEGDELIVIPAYNARGLGVVESNQGALWNSPEFLVGSVFAREAEIPQEIGTAQLLAVALTNRPAQVATTAEAVTLTESGLAREDDEMADKPIEDPEAEAPEVEEEEEEMISLSEHSAAIAALQDELEALRAAAVPATEAVAASESLAAQVVKLQEDLGHERGLREGAEDEAHYQELFGSGRVKPAEKENLMIALKEKRAGRPWMYSAVFAERQPNSVVDFSEHGHNQPVPTEVKTPSQDLHEKVTAYAEAHNIPKYHDALRAYNRSAKKED